ncbi:MAG: sensor histidine kinase [Syntrophobacteraceae bacterium]
MAADKFIEIGNHLLDRCLLALHEKDRLNYAGKFVQGFVHNANGPLQNLTMLTEMITSGIELQDRIFRSDPTDRGKWSELMDKQRKRLSQMREQIFSLAGDLREFMQLHEIERSGTEIDINALVTRMANVFRSDLFYKHQVKSELRLAKNLPHLRALGRDIVPALFHLFQNAVIAMQESPRKELCIATSIDAGEILLTITDSGCGLCNEQSERLFDLFESHWQHKKSETATRSPHLGFGLYAARRLLSSYGFTITLETGDEGTSALVRMPLPSKSA